ncbi:MAG: hypothetical protein FWG75_03200 [Cystobacterineae bacterium]|nr:hypothetical protein [Cystobacterineae bacterium]
MAGISMVVMALGCAVKRGVEVHAMAVLAEEDKAKPGIENSAAPEVHFRVSEGELNEYAQTTRARLKIQVDVYGAEHGAAFRVVEPDAYTHSLQCTALDMEPPKTLHQRWECMPATSGECGSLRPLLEGSYRLEVEARGKHGSTVKHFAWSYEKKLLQMHLEDKEEWGRDDALYVQLEGREETVWNRIELFADEGGFHRLVRTACPRSLPAKPSSQCFKVPLSALPGLPHGPYKLNLTVKFVDKAGHRRSHTRSFNIRINRQLWSLSSLPPWPASVAVTREGLLLSITRWSDSTGMALESFLMAINAKGEEVWRTKLPDTAMGLRLGNHRGLDVVLTNCFKYRDREHKGFLAFNAKTGEALSEACIDAQSDASISAIVQSGPDKDLVVLRSSSKGADNAWELCRFVRPHASSPWGFRCGEPKILPKTEGMGSVVRTPEGARVFMGSLKHHWCALEWKDKKKGRENETWTQGCILQELAHKQGDKWKEHLYGDELKKHFGTEKSAGHGGFLGVLPLSPTRSVVVFSWRTSISGNQTTGFLIDSPSFDGKVP